MILDTTYLLRLSGIEVATDLLGAIDEGRTTISFEEIGVSLISLFEIQAKAAKLGLPPKRTTDAIEAINNEFRVEPFYNKSIVEISNGLSGKLNDYIDCIILATAIALKEDLATEDTRIKATEKEIKDRYGINIVNYKELLAN